MPGRNSPFGFDAFFAVHKLTFGEGKVGDAGKPASRWYRRDGPRPTVILSLVGAVSNRAYGQPHSVGQERRLLPVRALASPNYSFLTSPLSWLSCSSWPSCFRQLGEGQALALR